MEERIQQLENRVDAEEKRNQYLVAFLWAFGNIFDHPTLSSDARRLALACDPNLVWPPAAPAEDQPPAEEALPPQ